MTINIENVIPGFLEKEKIDRSQIWNKTIRIEKGERIQIIAPSGSGKTSLVHFLYGMRKDYSGSISFNKKNITSFSTEDFAELRSKNISIIFQDLRLFPGYTVLQNLEIKRMLNPFRDSSIYDMAVRLGVTNKLKNDAKTCSFGEQQRIAIIRSLQQPFDFILMDEPFSHLDENNKKIAMELIEEEATKRSAGIILAELKKVEFFKADKIIHL